MSALAARRAAQLKASEHAAPIAKVHVPPPAVRATSQRPASPSPAGTSSESELELEEEQPEAGPSKRLRYSHDKVKPRYYAAVDEDAPPTPSSQPATPPSASSKKIKRKRAYSPGAPAESDGGDDSSANEGNATTVGFASGNGDVSYAPTPSATPGPSRPRGPQSGPLVATSKFLPRRGVNVEILSSETLPQAGISAVTGPGVVLSLNAEEHISLAGHFCVLPLQGSISLFSAVLRPSSEAAIPIPVFAPTSHPIPSITSVPGDTFAKSPILERLLLPTTFIAEDTHSIFLVVEHLTGVDGMRGGAIPGFGAIWGEEKGWLGLRGVHAVPGSLLSTCYPHATMSSGRQALDSLTSRRNPHRNGTNGHSMIRDDEDSEAPVVLIKGPKRAGKSTLARAALNNLLGEYERVAWLECDLGQGEFGIGGLIGLWSLDQPVFGPPFTHPRFPERAHFLGTYTPLSCPDEYLAAIDHLLQHYRYEVQYPTASDIRRDSGTRRRNDAVPLVINTQGWVKGLGEELLRAIESLAQATHVFAFEATTEDLLDRPGWTSSPTLPPVPLPPTSSGKSAILHIIEPAPVTPLQARYTAIDHRMLSTLAYLHSTLSNAAGPREAHWDFATPLLAAPPYEVILGDTIQAVYLIGEGADGVLPSDLPLALNGSLVSLLELQDLEPDQAVYQQNRPLPPFDSVTCLGFALIRAVSPDSATSNGDMRGTKLHLITPLPPSCLSRVNAIAKNGAMELPTPGLLDWRNRGGPDEGIAGVPWEEVPFFDVGPGGIGSERRKWRRNILRKGI